MYELKKIGKVLTIKSVGTGPPSYEKKRMYRAAVSQILRNTGIERHPYISLFHFLCHLTVPSLRCRLLQYERRKTVIYLTQVVNNDYVIRCEYTFSVGVLHCWCGRTECQSIWQRIVIIIIITIRGRRHKNRVA